MNGPAELGPLLEKAVSGMSFPRRWHQWKLRLARIPGRRRRLSPMIAMNIFVRQVEMQMRQDLNMIEQGQPSTRNQFEQADLHLNQVWRAIISSPCLSKPLPGDPPNAP